MKTSINLALLTTLTFACAFPAVAAPTAKAVLTSGTLTFYYDEVDHSAEGTVYSIGNGSSHGWSSSGSDNNTVTAAIFTPSFKNFKPTTLSAWFRQLPSLSSVQGLTNVDTSEVTSMSELFYMKSSANNGIKSLDLSTWDTSKVTNMQRMFQKLQACKTIYVGDGWTVANVSNSSDMFNRCNVIKGEKGTTLSSTDKTYARVDNAPDEPGYFTYKAIQYTVTFKDYDGTTLQSGSVNKGADAVPPTVPGRTGYTFTGWDGSYTSVMSDLVLTAQYSINTFTVTFEDWNHTVLKSQVVDWNTDATPPADPARQGYRFLSWDGNYTSVVQDETVTATYVEATAQTFMVTFNDWDGTLIESVEVPDGGSATPPDDPVREGYDFAGWVGTYHNISQAETVTASYTIKRIPVTFKDWDGSEYEIVNVDWNTAVILPLTIPSRTGYTFEAWIGDLLTSVTQPRTITATYTINTYTVRFEYEDGTLIDEQQVEYLGAAVLPADPVPQDPESVYVFKEWSVDTSSITADTVAVASFMNPYVYIGTESEYRGIFAWNADRTDRRMIYVITNDIAFETTPPRMSSHDFCATLDGRGHTLSGLSGGFEFCSTFDGTMRNIRFVGTGNMDASINECKGFVAKTGNSHTRIENCIFENFVRSSIYKDGIGGILGSMSGGVISNCVVRNCRNLTTNTGTAVKAGSILASGNGTIVDCSVIFDNPSEVACGGTNCVFAGGVVGLGSGTLNIIRCYNEAPARAYSLAGSNDNAGSGGILGASANGATILIQDCTNVACIAACTHAGAGGILGRSYNSTITIERCLNQGEVRIDAENFGETTLTGTAGAGGIVGHISGGGGTTVRDDFNEGDVIATDYPAYAGGIVGMFSDISKKIQNVGNVGSVRCGIKAAGGIVGFVKYSNKNLTRGISGAMNLGDVSSVDGSAGLMVGAFSASNFAGDVFEIDTAVLGGTVTSQNSTVGAFSGGVTTTGSAITFTVANSAVVDTTLPHYYDITSGAAANLASGVDPITQMNFLNRKVVQKLNGYASPAGRVTWVQGRDYPTLGAFSEEYLPGLIIMYY